MLLCYYIPRQGHQTIIILKKQVLKIALLAKNIHALTLRNTVERVIFRTCHYLIYLATPNL